METRIGYRYSCLIRVACFLLAILVLNISVDPKDQQDPFTSEDLSINEIETITEFIVEIMFGFTNAIIEHDEPDCEDGRLVDICKVFVAVQSEQTVKPSLKHRQAPVCNFLERIPNSPVRDIIPPPPKV